jgi:hypothetical protein
LSEQEQKALEQQPSSVNISQPSSQTISTQTSVIVSTGHSAYAVWRIKIDRALLRVLPSLGKKSNAQLIFTIVMIVITLLGTVGAGIYIEGYGIHPPAQYNGLCSQPATIVKGDCIQSQIVTITRSGTETTTTTQVHTGCIIIVNSTCGKK